jgi:hypothetical protein
MTTAQAGRRGAKKRWSSATGEQRRQQCELMNAARRAKREERDAIVLDDPRLPDTRITQITNAKPPPATATSIPAVTEILGTSISKLARHRVDAHPDAASLDYNEREYRENIERRKLRIEYYELTSQFDKATLWHAQLGKTLERHQRACAQVNRKKLEAEYLSLQAKLMDEVEAEVAQMTDEELDTEASDEKDSVARRGKDLSEMMISELREAIERINADLGEYAARPRRAPKPEPEAAVTHSVEVDTEAEDQNDLVDDGATVVPVHKRNRGVDWERIEAEARQAAVARVDAESIEADSVYRRDAQLSALKQAFPDYEPAFCRKGRDPFYG